MNSFRPLAPFPTPEEAAVATVLEATAAPLAVLDEDGRCIRATESFGRACGAADPSRLYGRTLDIPGSAVVRPFSPGNGRAWRLVTLTSVPQTRDGLATGALEDLPALVEVKGRDGRYLFVNRYAARLFGVDTAAAVGATPDELLGSELGTLFRRYDESVLAGRQTTAQFEEQFAGVDGIPRDWLIAKTALHDGEGRPAGVVTLGVDVTESRRTATAVGGTQREDASTADRTRYLAMVGHELRAPLASIIGCAEFLAEEGMGPLGHETYRDFSRDIAHSARHLQAIVNDILDMASIESGRFRLEEEPMEVDCAK